LSKFNTEEDSASEASTVSLGKKRRKLTIPPPLTLLQVYVMKVEFSAFEQLWAFLNQKHNVEFVFA
jgi:uncharacterized membrane protein (DUF485 family)